MKNNINKIRMKSIHSGIELLRFILCLWVVIIHCSIVKSGHKKYLLKGFHVPTFVLISFYFYYPIVKNRFITRVISRFQRILIPYILWPLLRLIINNFIVKEAKFKKRLTLYDFYLQILIGAKFHLIFWFQFNLIFTSIFLTIIAFIFKKKFLIIFQFLGIISLYLHYSGTNFKLFSFFPKFKVSLGSLIELISLSVLGCFYSSINLLNVVNKIPKYLKFILLFLILFLFKYNLFIVYPGFIYSNIILHLLASTFLFLLFGSLNLTKIIAINSIIKNISKYTGGIYYIHIIVSSYLRQYIIFFKKKSYFSSIIIYFICYIICYIGTSLFKNNKLKYLFN